jgi:dihydroflavonol-4-reductase
MVLITGASGLVGSHLAIYLLENSENVRAIFRESISIEKTKSIFDLYKKSDLFSKIEWFQGDILDIPSLEHAFENVEYVYHCAAMISFDPKDEEKLRKTNIEGTANVVNFCLSKNVKKLCFVSSIAALGDLLSHETIITEQTEWNPEKPHSDYAISKYGAEIEVFRAQQEGLNVVIVNPGVILGSGFFDSGSGEIFTKVKNGLKFYTNGSTGFVAVSDVVKIMFQLMKSEIQGERFVLVSENVTYKNLLETIATEFGIKKPSIQITKLMTTLAYKLDWILSNVFLQKRKLSKDMAKTLHSMDLYSNQKIKKTLNFDFEKVSISITKIIDLQS